MVIVNPFGLSLHQSQADFMIIQVMDISTAA
jgi:hypothetical protein